MPDNRDNVQVKQPGIEGYETADKNGWPDPLVSPLNPLTVKVTNGQSGTQSNKDIISTDGQEKLSLAEGRGSAGPTLFSQGGHDDKLKTSQMNPPNHSQPEGE